MKKKDKNNYNVAFEIWENFAPEKITCSRNRKYVPEIFSEEDLEGLIPFWEEVSSSLKDPILSIQLDINGGTKLMYKYKGNSKKILPNVYGKIIKPIFDKKIITIKIAQEKGTSFVAHISLNSSNLKKDIMEINSIIKEIVNTGKIKEEKIKKDFFSNRFVLDKRINKMITPQKTKLKVHKGDITKLKVDAIVNSANKRLLGGGGVDGAIHRKAGLELLEECKKLGGCLPGEAKITKGYNLDAKYVIHTVGPIYGKENGLEEKILADSYRNSLLLAVKNNIRTIAFPNISTGIYCYPIEKASKIAVKTVKKFLKETNNHGIKEVIFVSFNDDDYQAYKLIDDFKEKEVLFVITDKDGLPIFWQNKHNFNDPKGFAPQLEEKILTAFTKALYAIQYLKSQKNDSLNCLTIKDQKQFDFIKMVAKNEGVKRMSINMCLLSNKDHERLFPLIKLENINEDFENLVKKLNQVEVCEKCYDIKKLDPEEKSIILQFE